jgi:hypothetical protein
VHFCIVNNKQKNYKQTLFKTKKLIKMKIILSNYKAIAVAMAAAAMVTSCTKDKDGYTPEPPKPPTVNAVVNSAAGDSAAITAKLAAFRTLAGETINAAPGVTGGRREVNWDGVPANLTNTNDFPFDFFGASDAALPNGRKRGLIYTNTGTSFRVDSTDFKDIEPSYADQFEAFSKKKLFTYLGNNITEVTFNVPGTTTPAFTKAFAVIFSDVDVADATTVEYFNGSKSLGVFKAGVASQGFSLVGVSFPDEKITRIKITSGNGVLGTGVKDITSGGTKDLVVMDDFIYSEPTAL